jgi:DNA-directed RNA polymerase sigma subunit (sigma70/sigma32)
MTARDRPRHRARNARPARDRKGSDHGDRQGGRRGQFDNDSRAAILTAESGLTQYFEQIRRFPVLERREEYMLAKRWPEPGDRDAAHRLVTSHLRLVTKIACGYRGYGLPISEVISRAMSGCCRRSIVRKSELQGV